MVRSPSAAALLSVLCACGGGGGDADTSTAPASNLPPNAAAMQASSLKGAQSFVARLTTYEAGLMFALDPGSNLTTAIVVQPDPSTGAPFSVTFAGDVASGFADPAQTHLSGKATFASDPNTSFTSVSGTTAVDITILGLLNVYHADIAFTVGPVERTLSGKGVLTNPTTGNKSTTTVDAANPLRIVPATGPTANACGYEIDGNVDVGVVGPQGTYTSKWHFTPGKATVTVDTASHTDGAGVVTPLPAIEADLRCNNAGASITEWVGVYKQTWGCLPYELGTGAATLTVKDATTVTVDDSDPPGSGNGDVYDTTVVGGSVRALRGFFIGGPVGSRYREDFNWTLSPDGKRFFQTSRYVFQEGSSIGQGGPCFSVFVKQ